MNIVMWLCAGAAMGWLMWAVWDMNSGRGLVVSVVIGIVAAFFGGHVLAPVLSGGLGEHSEFSIVALLAATACAMASLKVADMVYERFGA